MNPSLHTALLAGLTLELAGMFVLGFYWLITRHRATRPRTPTLPHTARHSAFTPRDIDDWESDAPYPDHVLKAVRDLEREQRRPTSPSGTHREALRPDRARNIRTELHEATGALTDEPSATSSTTEPAPAVAPHCPHCGSSRVDTRDRARKTGRAIGSILGATGGIAVALAGAEAGAIAGIVAGPVGPVFGSVAGAVIATLSGSVTGSTIGSAVGSVLDSKARPRYQCRACGQAFSTSHQ
ncbi:hypothetical protein AB9075_02700 [Burkholderia thailandensis]|uniref:hypothetical protein n=1 Tax=Burkholderia thailandensis TaxID=57975 RepID=UPI003B514B2E